jgi:hypothetical protein
MGSLIETTTVEESNEVSITKLALSVGRSKYFIYIGVPSILNNFRFAAFIRPKVESELSIQDRHPTRKSLPIVVLPSLISSSSPSALH